MNPLNWRESFRPGFEKGNTVEDILALEAEQRKIEAADPKAEKAAPFTGKLCLKGSTHVVSYSVPVMDLDCLESIRGGNMYAKRPLAPVNCPSSIERGPPSHA